MSKKTKPAVQPKPQEKTEQPGNTPVTSAGQPEVENTEGAAQDAPEEVKAKTDVAAVRSAHAMTKRAKEVFNMYPGLPECYFTADETAFTERQHAVMHGQNLDVSEVITIKRSEV